MGISNKIQSVNLPVLSSALEAAEIVGIAAAGDHSAALSSKLHLQSLLRTFCLTPVNFPSLRSVLAITLADGRLFTWGRGFGTNSDAFSPQYLPSPLSFRKVALGWNHALLLTGIDIQFTSYLDYVYVMIFCLLSGNHGYLK